LNIGRDALAAAFVIDPMRARHMFVAQRAAKNFTDI
jgi:hypothetical protein